MASTSTGYNKSVISREQPSSSGQVMSFTSGCILNVNAGAKANLSGKIEMNSGSTFDIESGAKLTAASGAKVAMESGSTFDVESGGYLTVANGGYFADENLTTVTASGVYGTTVSARGTIYLNPTSSGNVTIQITSAIKVGQRLDILVGNSTKKKARVVVGNTKCMINSTKGQMLTFTTESLTAGAYFAGGFCRSGAQLKAITAQHWAILAPWSTVNGCVDLSSARAS